MMVEGNYLRLIERGADWTQRSRLYINIYIDLLRPPNQRTAVAHQLLYVIKLVWPLGVS